MIPMALGEIIVFWLQVTAVITLFVLHIFLKENHGYKDWWEKLNTFVIITIVGCMVITIVGNAFFGWHLYGTGDPCDGVRESPFVGRC